MLWARFLPLPLSEVCGFVKEKKWCFCIWACELSSAERQRETETETEMREQESERADRERSEWGWKREGERRETD